MKPKNAERDNLNGSSKFSGINRHEYLETQVSQPAKEDELDQGVKSNKAVSARGLPNSKSVTISLTES